MILKFEKCGIVSNCNLKCIVPNNILIIFHNLHAWQFSKRDIWGDWRKRRTYMIFNINVSVKVAEVANKDHKIVYKMIHSILS